MSGYEISALSVKIQELIKNNNNIDVNKNGLINEDELDELLSKTGKKNISDLVYDSKEEAKCDDYIVGGWQC